MAEFPNLGKHCFSANCQKLDFLPFNCSHCNETFCVDHKSTEAHSCQNFKCEEVNVSSTNKVPNEGFKCSFSSCKNVELIDVKCEFCKRQVCLQHRYQKDHDCPHYQSNVITESKTSQHVKNICTEKSLLEPKKPFGRKSKTTSSKVRLMKLKQNSEGDKSLPSEERIYLSINLFNNGIKSKQNFYFSKKWSIGKCIDYVSSKCSIFNHNKSSSKKKLRMFNAENGLNLEPSKCLENAIVEDIIVNGSSLILMHVDNSEENLENLQSYL